MGRAARGPHVQVVRGGRNGAPDVPAIDNWARTHWRWTNEKRAGTISNITAGAAYAWPIVALSAVHGGINDDWGRDLTATLSSIGVAQLATGVSKRAFRRSRPNVVFDGDPIDDADDVHSFFSAHTATTFAAVVSAGTIASRRGSPEAKWIWIGGVGLAGSTGYLRVAADRHFLTDALVGAAVGTAVGTLMPRLFDEDHSSGAPVPAASSQIVGMGPVTHLAGRSAAPVNLQFGAGVRSIGVVGTLFLRERFLPNRRPGLPWPDQRLPAARDPQQSVLRISAEHQRLAGNRCLAAHR